MVLSILLGILDVYLHPLASLARQVPVGSTCRDYTVQLENYLTNGDHLLSPELEYQAHPYPGDKEWSSLPDGGMDVDVILRGGFTLFGDSLRVRCSAEGKVTLVEYRHFP